MQICNFLALFVAKFLFEWQCSFQSLACIVKVLKQKRETEYIFLSATLGSGCGVVGMALAADGANVTLTEIEVRTHYSIFFIA